MLCIIAGQVDDTMPVILACMPILCMRTLALGVLTVSLGVAGRLLTKLDLSFAPFCCSTVMNMTCQLIAQAYKKWTIEPLQSLGKCHRHM